MDKSFDSLNGNYKGALGFGLAVLLAAGFSAYLYHLYLPGWRITQFAIPLNSIIASAGCYVLSSLVIKKLNGRILAAILYGFCPYALSFGQFHGFAGLGFAVMPWLLWPGAFISQKAGANHKAKLAGIILQFLPLVVVWVGFAILAMPQIGPFFPLPNETIQPMNLIRLYHLPALLVATGLVFGKRTFILAPAAAGLILTFCGPIFQTSPIIWMAIPMLWLSIMAGLGTETIIQKINLVKKANFRISGICLFHIALSADIVIGAGLIVDKIFQA